MSVASFSTLDAIFAITLGEKKETFSALIKSTPWPGRRYNHPRETYMPRLVARVSSFVRWISADLAKPSSPFLH
jgi:hypothetical protein